MTKRKINWLDIVIVVVVLAIGAFAYSFFNKGTVAQTKTITYTFELIDNPEGFTSLINVGDEITDNIKNYYMGKVVDVKETTYTQLVEDKETGAIKEATVEGRETAIVTVEAPVTEDSGNFRINGNFIVKTGLEVAVKGEGYAGRGFIINVERGE